MTHDDPWGSNTRVDIFADESQALVPVPPEELPRPVDPNGNTPNGNLPSEENRPGNNPDDNKPGDRPAHPATTEQIKLRYPPGVELPTKGLPAFWLWYHEWRQTEDPANPGYLLVPDLSTKEKRMKSQSQSDADRTPVPPKTRVKSVQPTSEPTAIQALRRPFDGLRFWPWMMESRYVTSAIHRLFAIMNELVVTGLTFFVGGRKGASAKTTLVVALSTVMGWLLRISIIVMNFNPAGDHAKDRLGIKKTVTFRSLLIGGFKINSHEEAVETVGNHPLFRNVYHYAWNDPEHRSDNERLAKDQSAASIVELVTDQLRHYGAGVIDMGQNLYDAWAVAALQVNPQKTVGLVTFRPNEENSEADAWTTYQEYLRIDPDFHDRFILVVSDFKSASSPWKTRKVKAALIKRCTERYELPKKRVVIIPHDPIFLPLPGVNPENGEQLIRVVDPRKFRLRTLMAFMNLLVVSAETSLDYRKHHPFTPTSTQPSQT